MRPVFGDTIAIHSGRHIIKDMDSGSVLVSNHTFASAAQNCTIVLGTSMSGKTTYLNQIALLHIMAQIGSFVPAKFAALRLTDKIFVRMGKGDDMYSNASTFTLEMREIGHIFRSATMNSLILIDDLGLSTTDEDSYFISYAVCEGLSKLAAFTFFATSERSLVKLQFSHPNIEICHFAVEREICRTRNKQSDNDSNREHDNSSASFSSDCSFSSCLRMGNYMKSTPQTGHADESRKDTVDSAPAYSTRYTYILKKNAGPTFHSTIEQLEHVALKRQILEKTTKYSKLLECENYACTVKEFGKTVDIDMANTQTMIQRIRSSEIDNSMENECYTHQITDDYMDVETIDCKDRPNLDEKLSQEIPFAPVFYSSPISKEISSRKTDGSIPDDRGKSEKLESIVERTLYKALLQLKMVSCVIRTIENASKESQNRNLFQKLKTAEENAMELMRFIQSRYKGILRSLKED